MPLVFGRGLFEILPYFNQLHFSRYPDSGKSSQNHSSNRPRHPETPLYQHDIQHGTSIAL
jgi:hypothetical protein